MYQEEMDWTQVFEEKQKELTAQSETLNRLIAEYDESIKGLRKIIFLLKENAYEFKSPKEYTVAVQAYNRFYDVKIATKRELLALRNETNFIGTIVQNRNEMWIKNRHLENLTELTKQERNVENLEILAARLQREFNQHVRQRENIFSPEPTHAPKKATPVEPKNVPTTASKEADASKASDPTPHPKTKPAESTPNQSWCFYLKAMMTVRNLALLIFATIAAAAVTAFFVPSSIAVVLGLFVGIGSVAAPGFFSKKHTEKENTPQPTPPM